MGGKTDLPSFGFWHQKEGQREWRDWEDPAEGEMMPEPWGSDSHPTTSLPQNEGRGGSLSHSLHKVLPTGGEKPLTDDEADKESLLHKVQENTETPGR